MRVFAFWSQMRRMAPLTAVLSLCLLFSVAEGASSSFPLLPFFHRIPLLLALSCRSCDCHSFLRSRSASSRLLLRLRCDRTNLVSVAWMMPHETPACIQHARWGAGQVTDAGLSQFTMEYANADQLLGNFGMDVTTDGHPKNAAVTSLTARTCALPFEKRLTCSSIWPNTWSNSWL